MAAVDELRPGADLDALIAEAVMGWKDVRRESAGSGYRGKRPDKVGRFRAARVPPFSTEPREAAVLRPHLEQLGRLEKFLKELEKSSRAQGMPADWAPPDQLCRAALKAVGARRVAKASPAGKKPARRAEALRQRQRRVGAR